MLVQFSFSNFRSFKESATLDMSPAKISSSPDLKIVDEDNLTQCAENDERALKIAVVYGSNASGKSNIVKAIAFMRNYVINSSRSGQIVDRVRVEPFLLDVASKGEPSGFEVVAVIDGIRYRYGFEVNSKEVISEWLYYVPSKRETKIFSRENNKYIYNSKFEKDMKQFERNTRANALFISVLSQLNEKTAIKIVSWFSKINFTTADVPISVNDNHRLALEDESIRNSLLKMIGSFDIGFDKVEYEEIDLSDSRLMKDIPKTLREALFGLNMPKGISLKTSHGVYDDNKLIGVEEFDLDLQESDGTKKLFAILPGLIKAMLNGEIIVIDEMDARLHSNLTLSILKLFRDASSGTYGQLIFTTHDTNLLSKDNFRRDQIWFVEKNRFGASRLYALSEVQTRNDANYEKDYLSGRYGGVPFISSLSFLGKD